MSTWDIQTFRTLCSAKGLPETEEYLASLVWKNERIILHAEQYEKIWTNLISGTNKNREIQYGSGEWNKAELLQEAHVEAAAQVINSMPDVLMQIINVVLNGSKLSEGKVGIGRVKKEISGDAPLVVSAIVALENLNEFQYIRAFVNTIKHRRLLEVRSYMEIDKYMQGKEGIRFKEFNYNCKQYPSKVAEEILDEIKTIIVDQICDIGNALNTHLSSP